MTSTRLGYLPYLLHILLRASAVAGTPAEDQAPTSDSCMAGPAVRWTRRVDQARRAGGSVAASRERADDGRFQLYMLTSRSTSARTLG